MNRPLPAWRKRHNQKHDVKWRGVVKVQRSLFTTAAARQILFDSQDGSIRLLGPISDDITGWFGRKGAKDEHKFFALAELRGTMIRLIRTVEWKDW